MLNSRILQFIPPTAQTLCNEPRDAELTKEIRSITSEPVLGGSALRFLIEPTPGEAQTASEEDGTGALLIFSNVPREQWSRQCRGWPCPVFLLPRERQEEAESLLRDILALPKNLQPSFCAAISRSVWQDTRFSSSFELARVLRTYFADGVALVDQRGEIREEFGRTWHKEGSPWRELLRSEVTGAEGKRLSFGDTVFRYGADGTFFLITLLSDVKPAMYMLLQPKDGLNEAEYQIAVSAASAFALLFRLRQMAEEVKLSYRDRILYDLLHNNLESEQEFLEHAKLWSIKADARVQVMVAGGTAVALTPLRQSSLIDDIEKAVQKLGLNGLSLALNNTVITLIFLRNGEKSAHAAWSLAEAVQQPDEKGNFEFNMGIGRQYPSVMDAYLSYQEAQLALRMYPLAGKKQGFIHYDDLGFIRLLSYIHDDLLLSFAKQQIGALLEYDKQNQVSLCKTLDIYCTYNGDIPKTAQELFLHQNTLRNRLRKIESLLDVDLDSYYDMINLVIGLKIIHNFNEL